MKKIVILAILFIVFISSCTYQQETPIETPEKSIEDMTDSELEQYLTEYYYNCYLNGDMIQDDYNFCINHLLKEIDYIRGRITVDEYHQYIIYNKWLEKNINIIIVENRTDQTVEYTIDGDLFEVLPYGPEYMTAFYYLDGEPGWIDSQEGALNYHRVNDILTKPHIQVNEERYNLNILEDNKFNHPLNSDLAKTVLQNEMSIYALLMPFNDIIDSSLKYTITYK